MKTLFFEDYRSGIFKSQYQYQSFSPNPVNHGWLWKDAKINTLLEDTTRHISELNAYSLIIPDVDLFIRMHIAKEATNSSRIEGTQTNMADAVMDIESVSPEKRDDWQEVQNYITAMNFALNELKHVPLSGRLLKDTHATLMKGVRGATKGPGEYRVSQNWIGGSNLDTAVFIPPHHEEVAELMSDLEKFWHNQNINVPQLIKIALSHYQFETIHPFLDGNGRIGRLLITLYLVQEGFLHKPTLYLSDFLERNKGAYYDALTTVRSSHNIGHWIKFFLTAVNQTAIKSKETFIEIVRLKERIDHDIFGLGQRAENAKKLVYYMYGNPILPGDHIARVLSLSPAATNNLIRLLIEKNILKELTGFKRNRIYSLHEYLALFMQ